MIGEVTMPERREVTRQARVCNRCGLQQMRGL